jgi:hypothetical protein
MAALGVARSHTGLSFWGGAGVIHSLMAVQTDVLPLCCVLHGLFAREAASGRMIAASLSEKDTPPGAGEGDPAIRRAHKGRSRGNVEPEVEPEPLSLVLSPEGRPLESLFTSVAGVSRGGGGIDVFYYGFLLSLSWTPWFRAIRLCESQRLQVPVE